MATMAGTKGDTVRSAVKRLAPGILFGGFWLMSGTRTNVDVALAQQRTPVVATRIYTGADGQTRAEQIIVKLTGGDAASELSETINVTGLQFRRTPPNYFVDWHPAPRRQYVITLSGRGEIELAGGTKIPIGPGHILLAEDVTGKGHITRGIGTEDRISLFIPLAAEPKTASTQTDRDVRLMERQFNEARARADVASLARLLADDWTITHGDGTIDSKAQYLADLRSGARKFDFVKEDEFSVRLHGDTAVAAGLTDSKVMYKGQPSGGALRFTRVYVKQNGRWQMIVSHATRRQS
jgi:ketosteroid isomerase-like protein